MSKLQIIETPQGERMVVLPIAEYERLQEAVETLEDIAAADEAMRRIEAGEELVPHEVVSRILEGENRIRVWREHRGLKVGELAKAAGISQPYLSQLESGEREGGVDSLRKIAEVLRVTIDDLV